MHLLARSTLGVLISISLPQSVALADVYTPPTDHPFFSSVTTYYGPDLLQDVERIGDCEARHKPQKAAAFVLTPPGSAEEQTAFKLLFGNNVSCLGEFSRLSVQRPVLRGVLAEALYKMPKETQPIAEASLQLPPFPPATMQAIADCVVQANGEAVRTFLLSTKIATRGEYSAFSALAQSFGPCVPAGVQLRLNADTSRLALAEAVYRAMVRLPEGPAK